MTDRTPGTRAVRVARWAVPVSVTALAALTRFTGLGGPDELIFDETYYVKDAWTLWQLGYEGTWGDDQNPAFEAGERTGFSDDGSFVAHPPLGKWIIGLGMAIAGSDPFGWRAATAAVGTLLVALVYIVARRMTGSVALAGVAGTLMAIDPLAVSMSRIALLDTQLSFLVLLAFWFALLDRRRTVAAIHAGTARDPVAGPVIWRRPWIIAAGLTLGLASAVKWSGLYALAVLGVTIVIADAIDRRRAGVDRWAESAIGRQGPASFLLLVPPAVVTYLVSWTGWLVTSGGYDRQSAANPLVALWNYHEGVFAYHRSVTSGHTYASPALEWIPMLNPTLMYREAGEGGSVGLMAALPNPLLWWVGMIVLAVLAARIVLAALGRARVTGSECLVGAGILATYAPWLLLPGRTMFTFYAITALPFVILAVVLTAQRIARAPAPTLLADPTLDEVRAEQERVRGIGAVRRTAVRVTIGLIAAVGLFFLPFGTGWLEPEALYRAHLWLPSWFL